MRKLAFLLFLTVFVACSSAQKSAKIAIKVPDALKSYYKEIDFTKTGKALYDDLAVLTISKHTHFLTYKQRHKYLYKCDASLTHPENVVLVYTGEERFWKEYEGNKNYEPTTLNTEHIYPRSKIVTEAVTDLHHLRVCDKKVNTSIFYTTVLD